MVMVNPLLFTERPCASVTLIVKVWLFPDTVGVPCTVTELVVLLLRVSPAGAATMAQVYGATPPSWLPANCRRRSRFRPPSSSL